MPVAAGIVGDPGVAALLVLTAHDMAAEGGRTALLDRQHHLQLAEADMAGIGGTPCRSMPAEDIREFQCRTGHGRWPLCRRRVLLVRGGILGGILDGLPARLPVRL